MAVKPITVSQLNAYIGRVLGTDPLLGNVVVRGEISGIKYHSSGHVYFSIVDADSKISCFLAEEYALQLSCLLTDGMEVILAGAIRLYKKNGTYTFHVRSVEPAGEGGLAAAFAKRKQKLEEEGLFAPEHKKEIPAFPRWIGVITSKTGAAVEDILKIISQRNHLVRVTVFPVLVQGRDAASDISSMIDEVNRRYPEIDTLIVGRGGGSAEDLWAFNEESVARSIFASRIPVISAVGHEIDFSISDFVADKRAETPTAAAQLAVPDTGELREKMEVYRESLLLYMKNKMRYSRLQADNLAEELKNRIEEKIESQKNRAEQLRLILEENNPEKILAAGYAVVMDGGGNTVSRIEEIRQDEIYTIRLKDGAKRYRMIEVDDEREERNKL